MVGAGMVGIGKDIRLKNYSIKMSVEETARVQHNSTLEGLLQICGHSWCNTSLLLIYDNIA